MISFLFSVTKYLFFEIYKIRILFFKTAIVIRSKMRAITRFFISKKQLFHLAELPGVQSPFLFFGILQPGKCLSW